MSDEKKPRIKLHFECEESSLAVHTFSVRERMSVPFEVKVSARSHNPDIHLDEIVGKVAGLGVRTETDAIAWTGVCSFMEQVQGEVSDVGLSTYHLTIVPRLWLLTQRRDHRIFQHLTIPEIVKKVFEKYEIEADWTLDDDHPKREYTVQYGETDFAFVSRLLELAGISYSFDRQGGGETGGSRDARKVQSRLVCSDNPQKRPSIGAIYFYDEPNVARQKKFVTNLRIAHEVRSGKVTLRDYDFRRPRLTLEDASKFPLSADEKVEEAYERYHFVHGGSLVEVASAPDKLPVADDRSLARHDKKENLARAERWAEAERWEKRTVELDASEPNLAPGVVFSVKDHPHPEVAEDKTLMVIESMVHGNALDWSLAAKSVFADTKQRYRPALVTPKPRVRGAQTAIVVGPAGKQIHVDEHARVRVKMHWDRKGDFNDEATCWLRVSHAWAGAGFGSVLHPRVGQEVIVDFFQGDPDQPLVTGRLHNMTTVVPRVLPKNKPQSVWRSATSPQTEEPHFNEIMIDDTGQKELMFVQAERDLSKLVRKNETERTFKDRTVIVGAARVSGVAELDTVQVGKRHLAKIVNVKDLHIPEMGEPDTSPTTTWVDMVDDRITITTGKATVELNGANIAVDAAGALRLTSDSMMIIKGGPDVYLNCSPATKVKPKVDKKVSDPVDKPDREIVAVQNLTNPKQEEAKSGVSADEAMNVPGAANQFRISTKSNSSFGELYHIAAALILDPSAKVRVGKGPRKEQALAFLAQCGVPSDQILQDSIEGEQTWIGQASNTIASTFGEDAAAAQQKLREAFLGTDPPDPAVAAYVDQKLAHLSEDDKKKPLLVIWNRQRGGHQTDRNTSPEELAELTRIAQQKGMTPVFVGDALPEGFTPPPNSASMTQAWKDPPFNNPDSGVRNQLQLFDHLSKNNGAQSVGAKSGGMDGPALLGMKTTFTTEDPEAERKQDRMTRWVGTVPNYNMATMGDVATFL